MSVIEFHIWGDNITGDRRARRGLDSIEIKGDTSDDIYAYRTGAGWDEGGRGGKTLKMVTFDSGGTMWGVDKEGNVVKWTDNEWVDQSREGWTLKMITFDSHDTMWCVGTDGNTARWEGGQWRDSQKVYGWTLDTIAFARDNVMWCVGTEGNVCTNASTDWNKGNLGGWTLKTLTFDSAGTMWCVGTGQNVGKWSDGQWKRCSEYNTDGWNLQWFTPASYRTSDKAWCVEADGRVGVWNPDQHVSRLLVSGYPIAANASQAVLADAPEGDYVISARPNKGPRPPRGTNGNLNVSHPGK